MFILSWKMLTFYWEILTDCLRKGKAKVLPRAQPIVFFFFFFIVLDITTRLSVLFETNDQNTTMTKLGSILKSRDITLSTKFHLVKAMVFPVVMYGCESWTIKRAEGRSIDAFELWCWKRLLRVPWTARRSNQSILNEISPEY